MKILLLIISPKSIQYKSIIDGELPLLLLFVSFIFFNDVSLHNLLFIIFILLLALSMAE